MQARPLNGIADLLDLLRGELDVSRANILLEALPNLISPFLYIPP